MDTDAHGESVFVCVDRGLMLQGGLLNALILDACVTG